MPITPIESPSPAYYEPPATKDPCECDFKEMVESIYAHGEEMAGEIDVDARFIEKIHRDYTEKYVKNVYGPFVSCDQCKGEN